LIHKLINQTITPNLCVFGVESFHTPNSNSGISDIISPIMRTFPMYRTFFLKLLMQLQII
jgi:hypothetical protein